MKKLVQFLGLNFLVLMLVASCTGTTSLGLQEGENGYQGQESLRGGGGDEEYEAGAEPIKVEKGDQRQRLTIKGLIDCVGVIVEIYSPKGLDPIALVGGHFVTSRMYDIPNGEFTSEGKEFIAAIEELTKGVDANNMDVNFYLSKPVMEGAEPKALKEGKIAAVALREALGIKQGSTIIDKSYITVAI